MKYDTQIGDFKNKLSDAKKILVVLPANVNNDKMAGALALYLSLKQSDKDVAIVSESEIRVSQSVLYGVGDVKKDLPEVSTGNFILALDGVVEDGKVPALVDLNWYPEGTTLNLVFNVAPGQKFEPINITHRYDTGSFDLIITVGVSTLAGLGNIYNSNLEKFTDTPKINIDNSNNNNLYGVVNFVDQGIPVSEMVMSILQGMSMPIDADIATNVITGVYDVTRGLTSNVSADTFLTIGAAMQMGGTIVRSTGREPQSQGLDIKQAQAGPQQNQNRNQNQGSQSQPRNDGNRQTRPNDNRNRPERSDNRNQPNQSNSSVNQPKVDNQSVPEVDNQSVPVKKDEEKPVGEILHPFKEDFEQPVAQRDSVAVADGPKDNVLSATSQASKPIEPTEIPLSEVVETPDQNTEVPVQEAPTPVQEVQPSQFETPAGEQVSTPSPEGGNPSPDWLTPKIFTGKQGLG